MLKVRDRLVEILKLIDDREMVLKNANKHVLTEEELVEEVIRVKVKKLADITEECLKKINEL